MVKHIVLYTLKEGVDKAEAVKLIASVLEPLVGKIPGLLHLEIRQAFNGMDYALYSEFESREALENYAVHPLHQEAKTHFFHLLDSRVAADYEVYSPSVTVRWTGAGRSPGRKEKKMKAIVTVVGKDRVGIIAGVCTALADFNVNVLDISQTVMQGYFTMMMATEVSACNVPLGELVTRMDEIGKEMGLSIRVQREDIFEAMHRI